MKKIAFITKNKILGQSFAAAIKSMNQLDFNFYLFLNSDQALLDAEIFEIDIALIDVMDCNSKQTKMPLLFCEKLNEKLPNCHILLLVSQDDEVNRKMATKAKKKKMIDDFVFYDASLKYLITKLKSFG